MSIHVMRGERRTGAGLPLAGALCAARDSPLPPAGGAHIRVTFEVDADGCWASPQWKKSTGVRPPFGQTDTTMADRWRNRLDDQGFHEFCRAGREARMLAEQKVEARAC